MHSATTLAAGGKFVANVGLSLREWKNLAAGLKFVAFCRSVGARAAVARPIQGVSRSCPLPSGAPVSESSSYKIVEMKIGFRLEDT
jgi:hypothetical protein